MSKELAKYQALPIASMNDLDTIGRLLSETNLFGTKNPADGFVIASMCHQEGISYMSFMQSYHFINGKVSKRADAIQAAFQDLGGEIEIVQRDEKGSQIKLTFGKTKYTSKCIWDEIKDEPFAKTKNYETPRKRMQMMWARAISDGVRTVCPKAVAGFYTPEEVEGFDSEGKIAPEEATKRAQTIAKASTAQPQQVQAVVSGPVYTVPSSGTTAAEHKASSYQAEAEASIPSPANQPANEPTPFTIIEDSKNPDYNICPVQGKLFGVRWETMCDEWLASALTLEMKPEYKVVIQHIIETRKGANQ